MVVWDGRRFFCARDRMGQKPLFCRYGDNTFEFASEIKAFDRLQMVQRDTFDLFEFAFDDCTIYADIFAVKPGHYVMYDVDRGAWHTHCYWDVEHRTGNRITNPRQAVNQFIEPKGNQSPQIVLQLVPPASYNAVNLEMIQQSYRRQGLIKGLQKL